MNTDSAGINFIKDCEGYKNVAYKDQAGVWTIGYGTTRINGRKVRFNDTCNRTQALKWLGEDLLYTEEFVSSVVETKLTRNEFNALVSLTYNIGDIAFLHSTLLEYLNSGKQVYDDLFLRWCKVTVRGKKIVSNGLLARRKREWALFIKSG